MRNGLTKEKVPSRIESEMEISRIAAAISVLVLAGCGGSSGTSEPHIKWSYRIGPAGPGRPRTITRPAVGLDGVVYAGGAVDDSSATACLYALAPDGTLMKKLVGTRGDYRGAPSLWPAARPEGRGAFAVDDEGGLYSLRFDGEDLYRTMPAEAVAHVGANEPKLLGPILAGDRGVVYAGGTGRLHALYIESRSTPVSYSVEAAGAARPVLGPANAIYAAGDVVTTVDSQGNVLGRGLPPVEDGVGRLFDQHGRFYQRSHTSITGGDFSYALPDYPTSWPRVGPDGTVYVTTSRRLHAIAPSGELKWEIETKTSFATEPALTESAVYVIDSGGALVVLSLEGEVRWQLSLGSMCASPAVAPDGTIYVACADGLLYALGAPAG